MQVPTPLTREFKISDESMLQDSRTTIVHFTEDKALFIALDDDFKDPFIANWDIAIADASTVPTDEQVIDVQTGLTSDVEVALENCRSHFQQAKYPIEKAFADKTAIWNEFGYDDYDAARRSVDKMITFMDVFFTTAKKYKTQLLAKKYTQAQIDEIPTKRQALIDAKTNQTVAKNTRLGTTQSRVTNLNAVWNFRTNVAKAAKVIFANNYAKYTIYLLPASEEGGAIYSIKGQVTDKAIDKPLADVQVTNGTETVTTDSNGKYGFAKLDNGTYTLTFTLASHKTATATAKFDGTTLTINETLEKA
jgi:hypothetical protein